VDTFQANTLIAGQIKLSFKDLKECIAFVGGAEENYGKH